jgi:hypothetical protein
MSAAQNLAEIKAAVPDLMARPVSMIAFGREASRQAQRILKGEKIPLPYVELTLAGGMTLTGIIRAIQEATDPSVQFETESGKLYHVRLEAVQAATVARLANETETAAFIAG